MILNKIDLKRASPTPLFMGLLLMMALTPTVWAAESSPEGGHGTGAALLFLWLAVILLAAKFAGMVERWGQPAVLGELLIGVILGNLALVGLEIFEPIKTEAIIHFLAELGVVILLFQIGLESKISEMRQVGRAASLVAIVGVILPFGMGTYLVGPFLLPGQSNESYLFLGAALTATSVGITARVFRDLGKLHLPEAKIVLGAAVIDDVLGLIVLAVVSAIAISGNVSLGAVGWIILKAVIFLGGMTTLGHFMAPYLGKLFAKIHTGVGMKFSLAISLCLIFAYLAELFGLAPIVGAFAAGLVLEPVHFREFSNTNLIHDLKQWVTKTDNKLTAPLEKIIETHSHHQIDELISPLGLFLVPIFFVVTGMGVRLETLANPAIVGVALALTVVAVLGKYLAGLAAGPVNKSLVGWGMVPRGEVGLIFAAKGKALGVVNDELFSVIVIMIILTTLMTPPILSYQLKKMAA